MSTLFSSRELHELSRPLPGRIITCLRRGRLEEAAGLNREMRESRVILHDFFADSCTVLWSFVGEKLGEDRVEDMFREIFDQSARRQFFDAAAPGAPAFLMALMLAKSWRAHSCFGAGGHPAAFSITEDQEKFTFHLAPCASGGRLWLRGLYEPGRGGRLSQKARPWTFQRQGLPYYCIHCAFMNEILPYESPYGVLMWPVELPESPGSPCAWHVYKNPNDIPRRCYDRLGLEKRPGPKNAYGPKSGRYFSDAELREMARPMTDRIAEAIDSGEAGKAAALCRAVKDEFLVLHDLYVNMLSATLAFIARESGEEGAGEALEAQYDHCASKTLLTPFCGLDTRGKIEFLSNRIFGPDSVNGAGRWPAAFSVQETESSIVFTLSPCGSGGRLLEVGAYSPLSARQRLQERMENAAIRAAARISLPDAVLRLAFPRIVDRFTQRKPWSQARTREAHPWSFDRENVPLYCCQCGVLAYKMKESGLSIAPPARKGAPCVWTLPK